MPTLMVGNLYVVLLIKMGYNMIIRADGFTITTPLHDYAVSKLNKLTKFGAEDIRCLLKIDNRDNIVELNADGKFLKVKGVDMYNAVAKAADSMQCILSDAKC